MKSLCLILAVFISCACPTFACVQFPYPEESRLQQFTASDHVYIVEVAEITPFSLYNPPHILAKAVEIYKGNPPEYKIYQSEHTTCYLGVTSGVYLVFQTENSIHQSRVSMASPWYRFKTIEDARYAAQNILQVLNAASQNPPLETSRTEGYAPLTVELAAPAPLSAALDEHLSQNQGCMHSDFGHWGVHENRNVNAKIDWGDRFQDRNDQYMLGSNNQTPCLNPLTHTYKAPGTYTVRSVIFQDDSLTPHWTATTQIVVKPSSGPAKIKIFSDLAGKTFSIQNGINVHWYIDAGQGGDLIIDVIDPQGAVLETIENKKVTYVGEGHDNIYLSQEALDHIQDEPAEITLQLRLITNNEILTETISDPFFISSTPVAPKETRSTYIAKSPDDPNLVHLHEFAEGPECHRSRIEWGDGTETVTPSVSEAPPCNYEENEGKIITTHRYNEPGEYEIRIHSLSSDLYEMGIGVIKYIEVSIP